MATTNPTTETTQTTDQQHEHLREVHEHLRHASTADSPEEIRERMRRAELALQRHEQGQTGGNKSQ